MDVGKDRQLVVEAEAAGPGPGPELGLLNHQGLSLDSQLLLFVFAWTILRRVFVRVALVQVHPAEQASFY